MVINQLISACDGLRFINQWACHSVRSTRKLQLFLSAKAPHHQMATVDDAFAYVDKTKVVKALGLGA
jgi:hypothetical protein